MNVPFRSTLHPAGSEGFMGIKKLTELYAESPARFARLRFEPKFDGDRRLFHLHRAGHHLTSRRESVTGHGPVDKIECVPTLQALTVSPALDGTVLDGELMAPASMLKVYGTPHAALTAVIGSLPAKAAARQRQYGPLTLIVFDILFHGQRDIRTRPFEERRRILRDVLHELVATNGTNGWAAQAEQFKATTPDQARIVFTESLRHGFEGLMIKDLDAHYGDSFWKWKMFRDTCAIVTGYKEGHGKYKGMIGAVKFSVYDGRELIEVGQCSGMDDKDREWITQHQVVCLGTIMEIRGNELDAGGRVRHPRFLRFRNDLNAKSCTLAKFTADMTNKEVVV